jgi:hypothetical protein
MSDGTCNTDCPVSSYSIANFLSKGKRENAKEAKKYTSAVNGGIQRRSPVNVGRVTAGPNLMKK